MKHFSQADAKPYLCGVAGLFSDYNETTSVQRKKYKSIKLTLKTYYK